MICYGECSICTWQECVFCCFWIDFLYIPGLLCLLCGLHVSSGLSKAVGECGARVHLLDFVGPWENARAVVHPLAFVGPQDSIGLEHAHWHYWGRGRVQKWHLTAPPFLERGPCFSGRHLKISKWISFTCSLGTFQTAAFALEWVSLWASP